jgi:hypothetical protein
MRHTSSKWFQAASFFAVVAAAMPASAQDPELDNDPFARQGAHETLEQELRAPSFERLDIGSGSTAWSPEGMPLGKVMDHVVDPASGQIVQCVVQIEGQGPALRAVPVQLVEWNSDDPQAEGLVLLVGPEDLKAMPEFDPAQLDARSARRLEASSATEGELEEGDVGLGEQGLNDALMRGPSGLVLASRLIGLELQRDGAVDPAASEGLGRVAEVWLHPGRGRLALLLVDQGGQDPLIVPWEATSYRAAQDESLGEEPAILLDLDEARLETAPRLNGESEAELANPEVIDSIYSFYGIPVPVDPLDLEEPRG